MIQIKILEDEEENIKKSVGLKKTITMDMDSISLYTYMVDVIESINREIESEEERYYSKDKAEQERIKKVYSDWEMKLHSVLNMYENKQKKSFKDYMCGVKVQHAHFSADTINKISQYIVAYINYLKLEEIKSFLKFRETVYVGEYAQMIKKQSMYNDKHIKKYFDTNIVKYSELIKEAMSVCERGVGRDKKKISREELLNLNVGKFIKELDETIVKHYRSERKDDKQICIDHLVQLEELIECAYEICVQLKREALKKNEEGIIDVIISTEEYLKKYEYEVEQNHIELEKDIIKFEEEHLKIINDINHEYDDFLSKQKKYLEQYKEKCCEVFDEYIDSQKCRMKYEKDIITHINISDYECATEISENILLGWLDVKRKSKKYNIKLNNFLEQKYNCYYQFERFNFPYTLRFDKNFNILLETSGESHYAKDIVRNVLLKILMTNQPGKVNLTLFDTIGSGEAFAMFNRIVSPDDRTNKIINGQIWTQQRDMQDKLDVAVAHISNVIQRCLQGKYKDILTYNKAAKQNAEPYSIISIMDFPANFNENMLKNLERIVVNGAQCGVFAMIVKNESEMEKLDPKLKPLAEGICNLLDKWYVEKGQIQFEKDGKRIGTFTLELEPMPAGNELESILNKLKEGIKNADKVVIEYDDSIAIERKEMLRGSTLKGIRVPIGVHGVDETQYLTLGVGGAQHALIAGQTGSGKSSLLHTIITSSLRQYSEDELNIYLVDFKRGVEFKLYANYILPVFKVIAVESEKEFGFNVLEHLDREQKIRADLFKKNNDVSDIEEYRNITGKTMPRILVIIDEFHELFSSENDVFSKKAAVYLERIVRQGRAFGIHIILASQSLSNIAGINKAVLDQMSVRIALKCSGTDADMLLEDGGNIIKQIATDDPGKAIYNSEGGNKTVNTEFRVSYLQPDKHKMLLSEISSMTKNEDLSTTRILLNNVEDNPNNIFNRFSRMNDVDRFKGQPLFLGETVSILNNMSIEFENERASNLLIVGNDDEKARNMFAFSVLSLCISAWLRNGKKAPKHPIVYLMNFKPLEDSYFKDMLELEGTLLNKYVKYSSFRDSEKGMLELYEHMQTRNGSQDNEYLLVYGLQNANVLKNDNVAMQRQELMRGLPSFSGGAEEQKSIYQKFKDIMISGPERGVHSIVWHDNYTALDVSERTLISYFDMRIGFNMSKDEYSQFVNENNSEALNDNNAIYYNRIRYNQRFRPYQAPDEEWMRKICGLLEEEM